LEGYASQHQQRPVPRSGAIFQKEWLGHQYEDIGDAYRLIDRQEVVRYEECWTLIIIDPAQSRKPTADPCAIGVFTVTPHHRLLVRHVLSDRIGLENIVPTLNRMCYTFRPMVVGIESDGFQVGVVHEARTIVPIQTAQGIRTVRSTRTSRPSRNYLPKARAR
jgi:hypothetical protein